jgi:hypothetical protein
MFSYSLISVHNLLFNLVTVITSVVVKTLVSVKLDMKIHSWACIVLTNFCLVFIFI